ncbi:MAG TPA: deoxyribonuclease IV [Bacilli bacterium]|nr:deoxyribonuclease IV [Bacilli bacterium]
MSKLIIGSHVGMKAPDYLLGAAKEAVSYGANTFMIYTGAPQTTRRIPTTEFKIAEGLKYMEEVGINKADIIAHAPYIINLGNTIKSATYELAVSFLAEELNRVASLGIKTVVLHPGAHVGAGVDAAIAKIIEGLNEVLDNDTSGTIIALETMAGKGTEIGRSFEELKRLIDGVNKKEQIGVCLDTCHVNDAGYDVTDVDGLIAEFDKVIGLEYLKAVHVNDSKNPRGAGKDRHENLGFGTIGFKALLEVINHPKLQGVPKILESPYVETNPPYKHEIKMIKAGKFNEKMKEEIVSDAK